ncbi:MAG TPA: fatty acid desaturase [Thermoanaerobaculia bacterium]|nr:fatty acid desaturase [Thermoanaerobaculia bacterium]
MSIIAEPVVIRESRRVRPLAAFGFALVHVAALGVFYLGFSWKGVVLCILSYYLRMFAITAGFHRYFSHRTYRLNRFWQFCMAFLGETSAQKGVLWWASNHRHHHKYSDMPEDIHSPLRRGFFWSHIGWILAGDDGTDYARIPDMAKYREIRFLDRNQYMPTMLYAIALALVFGPIGLFYGYFLSTVLLWHGTFSINSLMHLFGKRVYETTDDSRNSMILALVTMGEGWHNNHHYYPGSAPQGFLWWQLDASYYILWIGEKLGIVKDLRRAPARVIEAARQDVPRFGEARPVAMPMAVPATSFVTSLETASEAIHERIERLSVQWAAARDSARLKADHAIADLEARRAALALRIEKLQAEYSAYCKRAGAAAEKKVRELSAELELARLHLLETLENLLTTAGAQPAFAT